jgi:hypothetical protein
MALDNEKQFVDRWLDAAMKEYGNVEADSALEHQVLRCLHAAPSLGRSLSWQLRLVFATSAAVVLVIAGVIIGKPHFGTQKTAHHTSRNPIVTATIAIIPKTSLQPSTNTSKNAPRKIHHHAASEARAQAWPAQFPTPRPLTEQEKLLAEYVRERPQEAKLIVRAQEEMSRLDMLAFERPKPEQQAPHSEP